MKTTVNAKQLRELEACEEGLNTFIEAHGENTVKLSEALDSNGWDDIWWLISEAYCEFSQEQKNELHLLGCDWAERVLPNFENLYPTDKRPREIIEAKRAFIKGKISEDGLSAAESTARVSVSSASSTARLALWSAVWSVWAARLVAGSAVWLWSSMSRELKELFKKWESQG